ncbi:peroxynitrite isomerase THAP4 [Rhipicephalus sanguineus]|uniref:peroxynitrite isomerase THAP4 n=1 Tax=Rhipicephalus sanguineus TaxID=34632 RepID=UPI0020C59A24|nr:peroxynitrite isomerase THAP4 [Rhipicephalus sanguineus]
MIQDGVLSFHRLPRNRKMKVKWMKVIGRKQWPSKWWTAICSDHFVSGDFNSGCLGQGMLKLKAIPSVHLDKSVFKVGKASRVARKQLSRGACTMTTETAGATGRETDTLESSSVLKTNHFVVVTLNPSMSPAAALSTDGGTSGDGSAPDEAVPAVSPTTSGEQPEKLAMTESSSKNESTNILEVVGVAEEGVEQPKVAGDQQHSSKELEVNAPQEPEQQAGVTEETAAATEARPVDRERVTDSSTPSTTPEKVTATTTAAKGSQPVTAPTTPANSQQRMTTRANKKTPDSQHQELASRTSDGGTKSVSQPGESACDVCQRTFEREDLTKIFVEIRKRPDENSPSAQLCPFRLCPECKEPLLQAPTTDASGSSNVQRDDIVAKLHERALNTQPAAQMCEEVEAEDSTTQPPEPPKSKRVRIELARVKPRKKGKCFALVCYVALLIMRLTKHDSLSKQGEEASSLACLSP